MSKDIAAHNPFQITTFAEAEKISHMIAKSSLCPPAFKNKPEDVFICLQMGHEVGLSPMQAIQNIAVINSRPCLYGDGALAVAMSSKNYVAHREWFEGSIEEGNLTAYCGITRKNSEEYIKSFSMDDAKKASLWQKAGVWQQYASRMLQMRARAFAIRDKFADSLRGISIAEEVSDYNVPEKKTQHVKVHAPQPELIEHNPQTGEVQEPHKPNEMDMHVLMDSLGLMDEAQDIDFLQELYKKAYKKFRDIPKFIEKLTECKDKNKLRLEALIPIVETLEDIKEEEDQPITKIDDKLLEGNPY